MGKEMTVVVVGAGIAGLYATHRLLERGARVILCEAGPQTGGLLGWTQVGEAPLERFYHHFFGDDHLTLDALNALGIEQDWTATKTGFIGPGPGRVREFSSPHHILTYPGLSLKERMSLLITLARIAGSWLYLGDDVSALDHVSAAEWLSAKGGGPAYKAFFEPLIRKKFGAATPTISAAWMVGRLGMRSGRDSEGERLGYPRGSFRRLTECLESQVRKGGADIRLNTPVTRLLVEDGTTTGLVAGGEELRADAVLCTMSPTNQARLLRTADLEAPAAEMEQVTYQAAMVILVGLERSPSSYYWINCMDPEAPFGAIIDQTLLCPDTPYGGPTLYLACYPDPDDPIWQRSDEAIVEEMLCHLRRLFPDTMAGNGLRWSEVNRAPQAGILYHCGMKARLPSWRFGPTGYYVSGMLRCYPKRPINLVGGDAMACADVLMADVRGTPHPGWTDTRLPQKFHL